MVTGNHIVRRRGCADRIRERTGHAGEDAPIGVQEREGHTGEEEGGKPLPYVYLLSRKSYTVRKSNR
jgi:hypothetical protein